MSAPEHQAYPPSLVAAGASRAARRGDDQSWVEIASQPSSSSVSSIADEIVITGLRVGSSANGADAHNNAAHAHRRRRLLQQVDASLPGRAASTAPPAPPAPSSLAGSSQEEYEETESEEDRVLDDDDSDDDDDNGTALGVPSLPLASRLPGVTAPADPPTFRPQPNAFSHPPHHHHHFLASQSSYGRSTAGRTVPGTSAYRVPREDSEEALRASLSTLLSCAAAARGLPKKDRDGTQAQAQAGASATTSGAEVSPATGSSRARTGDQPLGLRFVPESELIGDTAATTTTTTTTQAARPRARPAGSNAPSPASASPPRTKPHASTASAVSSSSKTSKTKRSKSSPSSRVAKKQRSADEAAERVVFSLSPTVLTWVVSAGVVVLVSVVGFGAGFVIGREVGRQEPQAVGSVGSTVLDASASASAPGNATSCGRAILRSSTGSTLRRFRWGANSVAA